MSLSRVGSSTRHAAWREGQLVLMLRSFKSIHRPQISSDPDPSCTGKSDTKCYEATLISDSNIRYITGPSLLTTLAYNGTKGVKVTAGTTRALQTLQLCTFAPFATLKNHYNGINRCTPRLKERLLFTQ